VTLGDLIDRAGEIKDFRNLGAGTIGEVSEALAGIGVTLFPEDSDFTEHNAPGSLALRFAEALAGQCETVVAAFPQRFADEHTHPRQPLDLLAGLDHAYPDSVDRRSLARFRTKARLVVLMAQIVRDANPLQQSSPSGQALAEIATALSDHFGSIDTALQIGEHGTLVHAQHLDREEFRQVLAQATPQHIDHTLKTLIAEATTIAISHHDQAFADLTQDLHRIHYQHFPATRKQTATTLNL
jgi:hypothetical protein